VLAALIQDALISPNAQHGKRGNGSPQLARLAGARGNDNGMHSHATGYIEG